MPPFPTILAVFQISSPPRKQLNMLSYTSFQFLFLHSSSFSSSLPLHMPSLIMALSTYYHRFQEDIEVSSPNVSIYLLCNIHVYSKESAITNKKMQSLISYSTITLFTNFLSKKNTEAIFFLIYLIFLNLIFLLLSFKLEILYISKLPLQINMYIKFCSESWSFIFLPGSIFSFGQNVRLKTLRKANGFEAKFSNEK